MFGKGSSSVVDETGISILGKLTSNLSGIINSDGKDFHTILHVTPVTPDYKLYVDYRHILSGKHTVSYYPIITEYNLLSNAAQIDISEVNLDDIHENKVNETVTKFIADITDKAHIDGTIGTGRFRSNKEYFCKSVNN
jgi:hypothetical protein